MRTEAVGLVSACVTSSALDLTLTDYRNLSELRSGVCSKLTASVGRLLVHWYKLETRAVAWGEGKGEG